MTRKELLDKIPDIAAGQIADLLRDNAAELERWIAEGEKTHEGKKALRLPINAKCFIERISAGSYGVAAEISWGIRHKARNDGEVVPGGTDMFAGDPGTVEVVVPAKGKLVLDATTREKIAKRVLGVK